MNIYNNRFIPVTDWNKYHSWPPLGGLRHLVFNAHQNGFDKVIRRVGRRVLINEEMFFKWIEAQNANQNQGYKEQEDG